MRQDCKIYYNKMLGNCKLVLDTFCEVYTELKPYADSEFWSLADHNIVLGAVYVVGRQQFSEHIPLLKELATNDTIKIILSNPAEGSETLKTQCEFFGIQDLVLTNKILLLGGGDMHKSYPCLQYDSFLPKILDYETNVDVCNNNSIYEKPHKPYKFLFLNGRYRPHRKYLIDYFNSTGLLGSSIWTCLDHKMGAVRSLSPEYEYSDYCNNKVADAPGKFVKNHLFNDTWGEIYLAPEPYVDTYFSLVTETVFEYPYSFRTEKIWKPIAIGHPWIAVANQGYYRDMRKLGFQTFDHVIDESFDTIENNQDRLMRIAQIVEDLCQQDLATFLNECYNVCKYNQQHLAELRTRVREEFPDQFNQFIKKYINE